MLTVLQKEAAFSFTQSSRCLVTPLDTSIFSDTPGNFELRAAKFSMSGKVSYIRADRLVIFCVRPQWPITINDIEVSIHHYVVLVTF